MYLAKAGYPNGKNFPKINLDFNPEGTRHTNVAVEVQKQLNDHLNINLELSIAPHAQITEKSMVGNYDLLRLAWAADYPSPENFLWMFYGKNVPKSLEEKSFPNILRYTNSKFDELYEKAMNAKSDEEALTYFMQAEQIMMKDAPLLVLWYDEGYRLLQSYVKNFPNNAMQYRDLSEVFIDVSNYKKKNAEAPAN
jgi:peptide/nickel transport system substrate-binding protein